jgi:nicotinamide mononucleotide transporter
VEPLKLVEFLGVATAIAYLVLVTKRRWIAWPFYIASSCLYTPVFWAANLYADAALQLYFVVMGTYGWVAWKGEAEEVAVVSMAIRRNVMTVAIIVVASAVAGYMLSLTPAGSFGYADAFISMGSVVATYLTARKVLQSWYYWIVIDLVATVVFGMRGLDVTVWLYLMYTLLAVRALLVWNTAFRSHR